MSCTTSCASAISASLRALRTESSLFHRPTCVHSVCVLQEDPRRVGFGFSQLFYKLRDSGQIGRFPEEEHLPSSICAISARSTSGLWSGCVSLILALPTCRLDLPPPSGLAAQRGELPGPHPRFHYECRQSRAGGVRALWLGIRLYQESDQWPLGGGPGQFDAAIEIIDFLSIRRRAGCVLRWCLSPIGPKNS